MGWGLWDVKGDVKGGFQNVVGIGVLDRLARVEGRRGLYGWVRQFVSPTELEVS